MSLEVSVLTVDRYCIFRSCERIYKLELLTAGMAGYMCILKYNVCTLRLELIYNLEYRLFISRYRM